MLLCSHPILLDVGNEVKVQVATVDGQAQQTRDKHASEDDTNLTEVEIMIDLRWSVECR